MDSLQRAGGAAALIAAASYIVGFALFFGVIDGEGYSGVSGQLAFALDNQMALTFAMLLLYLVFGSVLLILNGALHQVLKVAMDGWSGVASAFGISWAALVFASGMISLTGLQYVSDIAVDDPELAATIWAGISTVQDGLGGGIEFVGGVWMALMSWLLLRVGMFSKLLHWLGITIGLVGVATALPIARDLAAVFGLGQIVWFGWIGVVLFMARKNEALAASSLENPA